MKGHSTLQRLQRKNQDQNVLCKFLVPTTIKINIWQRAVTTPLSTVASQHCNCMNAIQHKNRCGQK